MAPHRAEGEPRHEADVNATIVVAVDNHHVRVGLGADGRQELLVEPLKSDTIVDLDRAEDIRGDIADDLARVLCRDLVHPLSLEFQPADPVPAASRHDLHRAVPKPLEELPSVLAQTDELAGVVVLEHPQIGETLQDRLLVGSTVGGLGEEFVQTAELVEHQLARGHSVLVQGLRSIEDVLQVKRRQPHGVTSLGGVIGGSQVTFRR